MPQTTLKADLQIKVDYNASDKDKQAIRAGIVAFNESIIHETVKGFSVILKDNHDKIYGGLLAWLHSESVYIDVLWVDESVRHHQYGTKLLLAAEEEARKQGCIYSTVDTFSFQAEPFYVKSGYQRLGEIKNYLFQHSKIFLRKDLR
jgi:GNAT superfamily N-acetyltransferase